MEVEKEEATKRKKHPASPHKRGRNKKADHQ
jgi:hypothetical protein